MIKLVRVDHRLLHGQVAMSWSQAVGTDCILIANDQIVLDEVRKSTLKIAKPHGCKLVFKSIDDSIVAINEGKTESYNLLIVLESVADAVRLVDKVEMIKSLNLGGIKKKEGARAISTAIFLLPEEEEALRELKNSKNIEIEIRQVSSDRKIIFE